ncbi:hypothetical protein GQ55_5G244300 [Panicum hallii var. hallii]|uniref:Uncharacterized protein n=1 Tax=Panicum hallii var. hallii TaxID=1504633 RepID=A0A2T7DJU2_9POAL|nr:hypothetical protein GQ55_5G244300 [Panicum hallii var. hallii]
MIHESSGARTRTKIKVSLFSFQRIKERLISTSYEEDISVSVHDISCSCPRHIPPSDPARLVSFALACKNWLRVLMSGEFRQAYARRHGRPPFPDVGTDSWYALDVRQGRVVLLLNTEDLIVWLPVSGEQFVLPEPPRSYQYCAEAVICADSPECRDPECYSLHNFCVILVDCEDSLATFDQIEFFEGNKTWASIYSLNENKWGYTYALKDNRYTEYPLIERNPPVLYRDALYLMLETHKLEERRSCLWCLLQKMPIQTQGYSLPLHQGLAFAGTAEDDDEDAAEDDEGEGDGQNNISVWTLSDDSALLWSLTSIIDLDITLPAGAINPVYSPSAVGFVEGEATICIDSGEKIFTVEVESKKTRDIGPSARTLAVFPFLHFHMPTLPK